MAAIELLDLNFENSVIMETLLRFCGFLRRTSPDLEEKYHVIGVLFLIRMVCGRKKLKWLNFSLNSFIHKRW